MAYLISIIAYIVASTVITLAFYIVIMRWKKTGVRLTATLFQKAIFSTGLILDVLYNYTTLTVLMLQFPRRGEVLATARLKRTVRQTGYRAYIAKGFCWLLDQWDMGHCY